MSALSCPSCKRFIPENMLQVGTQFNCPACSNPMQVSLFPAALNSVSEGVNAQQLISEEDASCFYHADKVAVEACSSCGVYLCNLCELKVGGKIFCPKCFSKECDSSNDLKESTFLIDWLLLCFAIVSNMMSLWAFIMAPFIIGLSIYKWNAVKTPYSRGRWRLIVAILIASAQIIIFGFFWIAIITDWKGL